VSAKIKGSCSTIAIDPMTYIDPSYCGISFAIAIKKLDLLEHTDPIIIVSPGYS